MMINLSRQLFAVAICLSLVAYNAPLLAEVLIAEKNVDSQVDLWDVTQPQGEMRSITIDTTETTWSNLTISADGTTIAFDMLGDIYTMPITGGEAQPLVQGFDWTMQPSYSPDGKSIAFVSDRDGATNLWVMDANGENRRTYNFSKYERAIRSNKYKMHHTINKWIELFYSIMFVRK